MFHIVLVHPEIPPNTGNIIRLAANTGCTLHYVDEGVDTGEIISQRIVPVLDGDDEVSLHERIKIEERDLLVKALELFVATGIFK